MTPVVEIMINTREWNGGWPTLRQLLEFLYEKHPKTAPPLFFFSFITVLLLTCLMLLSKITWQNIEENRLFYTVVLTTFFVLLLVVLVITYRLHKRVTKDEEDRVYLKGRIIGVLDQLAQITAVAMSKAEHTVDQDWDSRHTQIEKACKDMLYCIRSVIEVTNPQASDPLGRTRDPKLVVFIPDQTEKYLIPFAAAGHTSIEHYPPLPISQEKARTNAAVHTWLHQVPVYVEDLYRPEVQWELPLESTSSEKAYQSIATILIKSGKKPLGVLSITGKEAAAYNNVEEKETIQLFGNSLAALLHFYINILPEIESQKAMGGGRV